MSDAPELVDGWTISVEDLDERPRMRHWRRSPSVRGVLAVAERGGQRIEERGLTKEVALGRLRARLALSKQAA